VDEEDYFKRHLKRHKTGFKYFQNENFEMKVKGQSKKRMFVFKCFICNHLIENTFELNKNMGRHFKTHHPQFWARAKYFNKKKRDWQ
jgi:hypothetical protein